MSMGINMASGLNGMLKSGHKSFEGMDMAVCKNIEAGRQLAAITQSSLGPNGMHKLVINHLDKIFVTSDCATIVEELEVVHPAARMLVLASKMQEQEVGDGTNLVVTFAGELLKVAEGLLRMGVHVSEIVDGYRRAHEKAQEILPTLVCTTLGDLRDEQELARGVKTCIAAKQFGMEDMLAPIIARACLTVMAPAPAAPRLAVDAVRVVKVMGGSVNQSEVVRGFVAQRDAEGSIKLKERAKVCVFGCGVEAASTDAKGTVLIKNADDMLNYSKSEEQHIEDIIRSVADAGVDVVVSGGTISEMAQHFIERAGMMVVKLTSKWELRRVCQAVGATALVRLGAPTPDELGYADEVRVKDVGGRKLTFFKQESEETRIATILLRASTQNVLNDLERAIDDGVNCVKAACRNPNFVPGGGATEIELARQIVAYADTCPGLDQYAIKKFGEALELFPTVLAENSGQIANDVVPQLYAEHAQGNVNVGVDVVQEGVADMQERGVLDLLHTKASAFRLAADAAITVLRVDQIIMAKRAGGPKMG